jgi:hypothetical protein
LSTDAERLVTLEGARWHCDQALQESRGTYVPVTDSSDDNLVVLTFDRRLECSTVSDRPVTG